MAVFRVERTGDYTVMSNYHLRDKRLSLKAKGLLSQMLSLPDNWDYTLSGLSRINKESKDAIRSAVNELENAGYVTRRQTTCEGGQFAANEYIIREQPLSVSPLSENPTAGNPSTENPTQINKERQNTDLQSTDYPSFASAPSVETKRSEAISEEQVRNYRDLIRENIQYRDLLAQDDTDPELLDEIVELMADTVSAHRRTTRVAGSSFDHEVVRSRLLKLNYDHIAFVMACMRENTTRIRCIKQYLLTALFNAPATIRNYYRSQVNHDLSEEGS